MSAVECSKLVEQTTTIMNLLDDMGIEYDCHRGVRLYVNRDSMIANQLSVGLDEEAAYANILAIIYQRSGLRRSDAILTWSKAGDEDLYLNHYIPA